MRVPRSRPARPAESLDAPSAITFEDEVLGRLLAYGVSLRRASDGRLFHMGLSTVEYVTLRQLANVGGWLGMSMIARRLRMDPSTITRVVGGLEAGGLVSSERSEVDRRVVRVTITASGADRYLRATALLGASRCLARLSERQLAFLHEILTCIETPPRGMDRRGRRRPAVPASARSRREVLSAPAVTC